MNPWNSDSTFICPQSNTLLKEESKKWKKTERSPALQYYICEDCRSKNVGLRAATSYSFSALQNRQYWSTANINLDRFYLKIICEFSSSIHPQCSQSGIKKLHTSQLNTDRCVMGDISFPIANIREAATNTDPQRMKSLYGLFALQLIFLL